MSSKIIKLWERIRKQKGKIVEYLLEIKKLSFKNFIHLTLEKTKYRYSILMILLKASQKLINQSGKKEAKAIEDTKCRSKMTLSSPKKK